MPMSVRLIVTTLVLLAPPTALCVLAIGTIRDLNGDLDAALAQYDQLRGTYEVGRDLARGRDALAFGGPPDAVLKHLVNADAALDRPPRPYSAVADGPATPPLPPDDAEAVRDRVRGVGKPLMRGASPTPADRREMTRQLDAAMNAVAAAAHDRQMQIRDIHAAAVARRDAAVDWLIGLAAAAAAVSVLAAVAQYVGVMRPLRRLGRGVRVLASGSKGLGHRLARRGPREFARLTDEVNTMADELQSLYHGLRDRVEQQSRQLVRSQRLAGLGCLAAGVAHEINNPLAIIAGTAEMSLAGSGTDRTDADREALEVIRDEAFRCQRITDTMLSLARPGGGDRAAVRLADELRAVADLLRSLKQAAGRTIKTDIPEAADHAVVAADPAELRQVLLNLGINALEGTTGEGGKVTLRLRPDPQPRHGGGWRVQVADDGRGMTPDEAERVFEPFYTTKRGRPDVAGCGLGLAISHAIVDRHGGRLTAASDGPGRGATFTLDLPSTAPAPAVVEAA